MKKTTMERKTKQIKNVDKAVLVLGVEEQHAGEGGHSRRTPYVQLQGARSAAREEIAVDIQFAIVGILSYSYGALIARLISCRQWRVAHPYCPHSCFCLLSSAGSTA